MTYKRRDLHWWVQHWPKLKKVGKEYKAPCPNCGGKDRFSVRKDGVIHCRHCEPHINPGAYIAILESVGVDFEKTHTSRALLRRRW